MDTLHNGLLVSILENLHIVDLCRVYKACNNLYDIEDFKDCIQYVVYIRHKHKKTKFQTIDEAANSGIIDRLINLKVYDIQSTNLCNEAASEGHLDCLKYAHENGRTWDNGTCRIAAQYGHLDCLKYAHENGCPWDEKTCSTAASEGHLDCLKYAHENGCPWNEWTCLKAAEWGYLDCLKYAHENGCP